MSVITQAIRPYAENLRLRQKAAKEPTSRSIPGVQGWLNRIQDIGVQATPYMITDLDLIIDRCKLFKKELPKVKLFYAVKCFPSRKVIEAIEPYVDGFDVASGHEAELVSSLGIKPERLLLSNPVKSEDTIRRATKLKVDRFAFQSHGELLKIAKICPGASVYVRVRRDDSSSALSFSSKFGCKEGEVIGLLLAAKELGLKPVGLTFNLGSQTMDTDIWRSAVKRAGVLAARANRAGFTLEFINVGGGFPVGYRLDSGPSFGAVARSICKGIGSVKTDISYVGEPGRFLVADSSVIVTSVIGAEERDGKTWLYLDVGAFQAFVEIFEFHEFVNPVFSLRHMQSQVPDAEYISYALTGPTCDSYDTLTLDIQLPAGIEVGDKLVITMTGAYTLAYGSDFNGFSKPAEVYVSKGSRV